MGLFPVDLNLTSPKGFCLVGVLVVLVFAAVATDDDNPVVFRTGEGLEKAPLAPTVVLLLTTARHHPQSASCCCRVRLIGLYALGSVPSGLSTMACTRSRRTQTRVPWPGMLLEERLLFVDLLLPLVDVLIGDFFIFHWCIDLIIARNR